MADSRISDLTAATVAAAANEIEINEAGVSKKVTGAQIKTFINNAPVFAAGSATANTWPKLTAGALLTTPEVGALELDANCLYGTTDAGNRGYIPIKHFIRADATRTFTSNTSSQPIFTSPANGRITLEAGLYRVEGLLAFTAMEAAGASNRLINLLGAGTATIAAWLWQAFGQDQTVGTVGAVGGSWMTTSTSPASIITGVANANMIINIQGTFEVTAAGTLIPSTTMAVAAASVLSIGSYLMFERMGSTSVVSVGQWD